MDNSNWTVYMVDGNGRGAGTVDVRAPSGDMPAALAAGEREAHANGRPNARASWALEDVGPCEFTGDLFGVAS